MRLIEKNEIFQFIRVKHKCIVVPLNKSQSMLACFHNAGFYSNLTETIMAITEELKIKRTPISINFAFGFGLFKDDKKMDIYPEMFSMNNQSIELESPLQDTEKLTNSNKGIYKGLNFSFYSKILEKYFSPTKKVLKEINTIKKKYKINSEKLITVFYRGTDKQKEVTLSPPEEYLNLAEKILKENPGFKILIQTDQKQVADLFLKHFKENCFSITELPTTEGKEAIHKTLKSNKLDFAIKLDAVVRILSKSKYLILGSGNMACIMTLYRGNGTNLYQFDSEGKLISPDK